MSKKTGGPASPVLIGHNAFQQPQYAIGLTKRDYFAAHAPFTQNDVIHFAEASQTAINGPEMVRIMAYLRYQYADAMLAEREKP